MQKRHDQIVDAASVLFSKKGFNNTSVRDIAAELNMNIASLYKYIETKEDILFLFYKRIHQNWTSVLEETIIKENEDPREQLWRLINTGLKMCLKLKREILTIFVESRHLEGDALSIVLQAESDFIKAIERLIVRGRRLGKFHVEDTYFAANIIQYLLMIYPLRSWSLNQKYNFDEIVDKVTVTINDILKVQLNIDS